jgi:hypothetical protein
MPNTTVSELARRLDLLEQEVLRLLTPSVRWHEW